MHKFVLCRWMVLENENWRCKSGRRKCQKPETALDSPERQRQCGNRVVAVKWLHSLMAPSDLMAYSMCVLSNEASSSSVNANSRHSLFEKSFSCRYEPCESNCLHSDLHNSTWANMKFFISQAKCIMTLCVCWVHALLQVENWEIFNIEEQTSDYFPTKDVSIEFLSSTRDFVY